MGTDSRLLRIFIKPVTINKHGYRFSKKFTLNFFRNTSASYGAQATGLRASSWSIDVPRSSGQWSPLIWATPTNSGLKRYADGFCSSCDSFLFIRSIIIKKIDCWAAGPGPMLVDDDHAAMHAEEIRFVVTTCIPPMKASRLNKFSEGRFVQRAVCTSLFIWAVRYMFFFIFMFRALLPSSKEQRARRLAS